MRENKMSIKLNPICFHYNATHHEKGSRLFQMQKKDFNKFWEIFNQDVIKSTKQNNYNSSNWNVRDHSKSLWGCYTDSAKCSCEILQLGVSVLSANVTQHKTHGQELLSTNCCESLTKHYTYRPNPSSRMYKIL